MPAILPPEIGKTLEGLFKKGAASEGGDWIKEYVDFSEHEAHGILPPLRIDREGVKCE